MNSYNRGIGIVQTDYLTIANNFIFNVMGHAVFFEDAIEQYNTVENNLVMYVKQSFSLLDTDQTPACFWITNPNNYINNNRAVACGFYGFWLDYAPHSKGVSANSKSCPEGNVLGSFNCNQAHTLQRAGLRLSYRHHPREKQCQPTIFDWMDPTDYYHSNHVVNASYVNFKAWMCLQNGAIFNELGDIWLIGF
jgi:hypothetical protein